MSMLPSALILGCVAFVALRFTRGRAITDDSVVLRRAAIALMIATVVQGIHFSEEALTGFHESFPAAFGQADMSYTLFLAFNVGWLCIWAVSIPGLLSGRSAAFFAAWFLAIAGVLNAIAHPLLAVTSRGYFPGLLTSPLVGVAAAVLWARLRDATIEQAS
jgi:hypothetical protein